MISRRVVLHTRETFRQLCDGMMCGMMGGRGFSPVLTGVSGNGDGNNLRLMYSMICTVQKIREPLLATP